MKNKYDEATLLGTREMLTSREVRIIKLQAYGSRIAIYSFLACFIFLGIGFVGYVLHHFLFDAFLTETFANDAMMFKQLYIKIWIIVSLIPLVPFIIFTILCKLNLRKFHFIVGQTRTTLHDAHKTVKELDVYEDFDEVLESKHKTHFLRTVDRLDHNRETPSDVEEDIEMSLHMLSSFDRVAHKAKFLLAFYHVKNHVSFIPVIFIIPGILLCICSGMLLQKGYQAKHYAIVNHNNTYALVSDIIGDSARVSSTSLEESLCSITIYYQESATNKVFTDLHLKHNGMVYSMDYNYQWKVSTQDNNGQNIAIDNPDMEIMQTSMDALQSIAYKCKGTFENTDIAGFKMPLTKEIKQAIKNREAATNSTYFTSDGIEYRYFESFNIDNDTCELYTTITVNE